VDDLREGDLILRPSWPLPDLAGRRVSYGFLLMMVPGAVAVLATTRLVIMSLMQDPAEPGYIVVALGGLAFAIMVANSYDGITIAANHQRVVVTRWFRAATVMPVSDLASLTRSTVEIHAPRRTFDERQVSFITKDGQRALTVDWEKFTDDDLDQLSKVTGVRQDGGWFYKQVA
jgi:hypothetical protein